MQNNLCFLRLIAVIRSHTVEEIVLQSCFVINFLTSNYGIDLLSLRNDALIYYLKLIQHLKVSFRFLQGNLEKCRKLTNLFMQLLNYIYISIVHDEM